MEAALDAHRADAAFRKAGRAICVGRANHVLAFLTARLASHSAELDPARLGTQRRAARPARTVGGFVAGDGSARAGIGTWIACRNVCFAMRRADAHAAAGLTGIATVRLVILLAERASHSFTCVVWQITRATAARPSDGRPADGRASVASTSARRAADRHLGTARTRRAASDASAADAAAPAGRAGATRSAGRTARARATSLTGGARFRARSASSSQDSNGPQRQRQPRQPHGAPMRASFPHLEPISSRAAIVARSLGRVDTATGRVQPIANRKHGAI
jgi:hypothetical protein